MAKKRLINYSIAEFCDKSKLKRVELAKILGINHNQRISNMENSEQFDFFIEYNRKTTEVKVFKGSKSNENLMYSGIVVDSIVDELKNNLKEL